MKKLTEQDIIVALNQAIAENETWNSTNLSAQRTDAFNYYYGSKPTQPTKGRSSYCSLDVQDSVEALQASLLNVFGGERSIVEFRPYSNQDKDEVDNANLAINFVVNTQNDQWQAHHDCIFDGLIGKAGVSKVYYTKNKSSVDIPFEGTRDQLDLMLAEDDEMEFEEKDSQIVTQVQPLPGTEFGVESQVEQVTGMLTKYYDEHVISIDIIPPEEFLIDERATTCEDAVFTCHQREVTMSELREMGFPKKKLAELTSGSGSNTSLDTNQEKLARNQYDGTDTYWDSATGADESMQLVTLNESYFVADYKGKGVATMRQIFSVDNTVLEMTDVTRNPFHEFVPLPVSHKFYGMSVSDRIKDVQIQKSRLTRAILDNAELNNNTRFIANVGQLKNPRELTDTRFGGVVRAKGNPAGIVGELAKPQLSPQTFPTIEMLDRDKESRVGMNRVSQGLDEDAMKPGVAARKVNQLLSVSQQRQKMMARQYGNYWKGVIEHVYELIVSYYPVLNIPNPDGEMIVMRPMEWKQSRIACLSESLAFGESEAKAQQLMQVDQMLTQDPNAANMYTQENKYQVWEQVYELLGYPEPYLTKVDPNQPSPVQAQQLQATQQQTQAIEKQTALQMQQLQIKQQEVGNQRLKIEADAKYNQKKLELDTIQNADSQELDEQKQRLDATYKADLIRIQEEELALERQKAAIEARIEVEQGRAAAIQ